MMRKTLTLVAAMGLLVAACGDDEDSDAGSTSTAAAETTAAPETTGAPDSTSVETTAGGSDASGVTLDEAGRLVPAECTGDDNVANEDEGVTEDKVNLAALNMDLKPVADLGFSASDRDMSYMKSVFIDAANATGGVCGRTIDLQQVLFNILAGASAIGEGCVEVTQDRANLAVLSGHFQDPLCITAAGVPLLVGYDITEAEMADSDGLLFSRYPSVNDQYRATAQYALDSGALDGKVGVWYGEVETELGDVAEDVVLPMLDAADIDYTAVRTDYAGPQDPQGNAVLTAAATEFASAGVDTVLTFVGNMNLSGLQLELDAQGVTPHYISMPIAGNSANELFAVAMGTGEITDGMEYVTFSEGLTELDASNPIAKSCNDQWTELTGEVVEPNTYGYLLVTVMCVTVDETIAALSLAGGDLTRESFVKALDALPSHEPTPFFGATDWSPEYRFGPAVFSVQDFDGATNTVSTREETFTVR